MQIHMSITGTTPLLMHSDAGVNAEHPLNKAKALLTKKTASKRTAEENREIRRLEWLLPILIGLAVFALAVAWVRFCRWLDRPLTDEDRLYGRIDEEIEAGAMGGYRLTSVAQVIDDLGSEAGATVFDFPPRLRVVGDDEDGEVA